MTETKTTKCFADRLNDLIIISGKDIRTLAKESGVSSGALSKYRSDNAEAGIINLKKIADHFKVSADYLLGRTKYKTPKNEVIGKILGIDDNAIRGIRFFNTQPDKTKLVILGKLLELGGGLYPLLDYVQIYQEVCRRAEEFAKLSDQTPLEPIKRIIENGVEEENYVLMKNEEYSEFLLLQIQQEFGNLIKQQFGWDRKREEEKVDGKT